MKLEFHKTSNEINPSSMIMIADTIHSLLDQLPSAERRLADVVLAHTEQLALYSANELAAKANVSAATAARFFKRLGFASFNEFRRQARLQMNDAAPLNRLSQGRAGRGEANIQAFLQGDQQNLNETLQAITTHHLDAFTEAALKARHIWVVGFRNGQILASYLQALLQQLRPGVQLFVGVVAHIPEQLSDIIRDDLVIVMDFRRRSILLKALVDYVQNEGSRLVLITDLLEEPLARANDITFVSSTRGDYLFDSHAGTMSLLNYLASHLARQIGKPVAQKLQKIENIHKSMRDIISG